MSYGIGITNNQGNPVIELDSAQVQIYKTFVTVPETLMRGRTSSSTIPSGEGAQTLHDFSCAVPHVMPIGLPREEVFIFIAPYQYSNWIKTTPTAFGFHYGELTNMRFPHIGTGTNSDGQAYTTMARTPTGWGSNGNSDPKADPDSMCGQMHGGDRPVDSRPSGTPTDGNSSYTHPRVVADPPTPFDFVGGTITKPDGTTTTVDRAEADGTANVRLYFDNGNPTAGNDNAHGFNQTWSCFFVITPALRGGDPTRKMQVKVGVKNDLEDTAEAGAYGIAAKTITAGVTTYNFNSNRENFIGQEIVSTGNLNGLTPSTGYDSAVQGSGYDDTNAVQASSVIVPDGQNQPGWTADDAWFFATPLFGPTYCMYDGEAFPVGGGNGRALNSTQEKIISFQTFIGFADTAAGHTHFGAATNTYRINNNNSLDIGVRSGMGFQACIYSAVSTNRVGSTIPSSFSESDLVFQQNRVLIQGIIT